MVDVLSRLIREAKTNARLTARGIAPCHRRSPYGLALDEQLSREAKAVSESENAGAPDDGEERLSSPRLAALPLPPRPRYRVYKADGSFVAACNWRDHAGSRLVLSGSETL